MVLVACWVNSYLLCRVDEILSARGWRKSDDPNILHYRLKWTELKVNINFEAFRAGKVSLLITIKPFTLNCLSRWNVHVHVCA